MGGYKKRNGSSPQRSKLIADKERRSICASQAFALYRPVSEDSTAEIYERTHRLQQEFDIPEKVDLFSHDLHSSIVQTRRVRKCLISGLAGGFILPRDLPYIKNGMPKCSREGLSAYFTGVDTVGRNRNVLIARIKDKDGILEAQRRAACRTLGDLGLKLCLDRAPHITLGVSESGLSVAERESTIDSVFELIRPVEVTLLPVVIEHNNTRALLDCAKDLG